MKDWEYMENKIHIEFSKFLEKTGRYIILNNPKAKDDERVQMLVRPWDDIYGWREWSDAMKIIGEVLFDYFPSDHIS